MSIPENPLALAVWRRAVAELYAAVRRARPDERQPAWHRFRERRDELFREHVQTPLTAAQRSRFGGLAYYKYDPAARVVGTVETGVTAERRSQELSEGPFAYRPIARASFALYGESVHLSLYWIEGYGGGLFLPFRDATNGSGSYGGGRYLYDTIKGADLGAGETEIILDFNYAYNPSCAYNVRWICPLPPQENRLPLAVRAGEMDFEERFRA